MNRFKLITSLCLLAVLNACSGNPEKDEPDKGLSAAQLYREAKASLDAGQYEEAVNEFETLEARYPFGKYAQQAQLDAAYAYYKYGETDSAIASAERFIKLNPKNPHVDYAYYLKGLANFDRSKSLTDIILPQDAASKDTTSLRQAFDDFAILTKKFPDSRYAEDARQRMIFLYNQLATHEIKVAEYYMRRGAYVAAINRCKYAVENYPSATALPDALSIMVAAYRKQDLNDLADDTLRILATNFPEQAAKVANK